MKRVGQIFRENIASDITKAVKENESVFLLTYTKLTSRKINELRKDLNKAGADVFVAKNRVAQIALKELGHEALADRIAGQTALIWGNTDTTAVTKILVKFVKDHQTAQVKGGLLDGKLLEATDVKKLSDLPSREVLLAQLLATLQAPASRLAYVLNGKTRELLSILKQLSEKQGGK